MSPNVVSSWGEALLVRCLKTDLTNCWVTFSVFWVIIYQHFGSRDVVFHYFLSHHSATSLSLLYLRKEPHPSTELLKIGELHCVS